MKARSAATDIYDSNSDLPLKSSIVVIVMIT
jgi:hypothetical protein